MSDPLGAPPARCPQCGTELAPALLACPACGRLVHAEELKRLAAQAEAAAAAGDAPQALAAWRRTYDLLPPHTRQARAVAAKIEAIGPAVERAGAAAPTRASPLFATRGTVLSMLASFGLYGLAFGWSVGLGLVLSIYVHELGHVAALRRYGIEPTALMFVPGLGAMVRWRGYPMHAVQAARIGLAGPLWGLGAALVAYAVYRGTGSLTFGAIARAGALLNLVNLMPFIPLDGGHGARALNAAHRWALAVAFFVLWRVTDLQVLPIILFGAIASALMTRHGTPGDHATFAEFAGLAATLALLTYVIHVPVRNLLP